MSHPSNRIQLDAGECRLIVVQDQLQPCPYLPGVTARMPLRLPVGTVTPEITDQLLERGFRRSGNFLYTPQCPNCSQCQPTRLDVAHFHWSSSLRRVARRGDRELRAEWAAPTIDVQRLKLFNRHRDERGLGVHDEPVDADSYRSFLSDTCCDTRELSIWFGDRLIAVSTIDAGRTSLSAVYTFFDPDYSRYSLGTYAILTQIRWALQHGRRYVYLGMYVAENVHLNYKARFVPQQRLQAGRWVAYESG